MKIITVVKLRRTLLLAVVVTVSAVCWLGCGGDSSDNSNNENLDSRLVCGDGEAWVSCEDYGDGDICKGNILRADGSWVHLRKGNGVWSVRGTGRWETSGNTFALISADGEKHICTYSISGNIMTVVENGGEPATVNKMSGIYPQ